jgi:hypothetical protein
MKLAAVVAFVLVAGMVARMGYERSVSPVLAEDRTTKRRCPLPYPPRPGREVLNCASHTGKLALPVSLPHPHHVQLRKKRNKSNKEPVWRSSTSASGLPR